MVSSTTTATATATAPTMPETLSFEDKEPQQEQRQAPPESESTASSAGEENDDTNRILAALTARLEQLEEQCGGLVGGSSISSGGGYPSAYPFHDSSMSTVSLLTSDDLSVGSNSMYHLHNNNNSFRMSSSHINDDADTVASRERIAKLRKSKRTAEQEGTKKLHKSHSMLNRICKENEALKAKQAEWEKERKQYRKAIQDMNALVQGLQKALTTTHTPIGKDDNDSDAVRSATAANNSRRGHFAHTSSPIPVLVELDEDEDDETDTNDESTELTPEAALEMTLKHTKVTIERLDEECQELEKSAESKQEELESIIREQHDMIVQLQEEKELQTVQILTLRDYILTQSNLKEQSTSQFVHKQEKDQEPFSSILMESSNDIAFETADNQEQNNYHHKDKTRLSLPRWSLFQRLNSHQRLSTTSLTSSSCSSGNGAVEDTILSTE